jgi:hypothetical protein
VILRVSATPRFLVGRVLSRAHICYSARGIPFLARITNVDAAGAERADVHASTVRLKVGRRPADARSLTGVRFVPPGRVRRA